jgi:DNA polymerase (family 10)
VLYNDTQLDIRLTDEKSYGASLIYYTGSLRHVAILTERAEKRGYMFTPMGLFNAVTGIWIAGDTEGGIFKELELAYIPPELREGGREIFRAGRNMLPQLVTFNDMRGDMRIRTDYDKGGESLHTIARYAINAFPHYEYLVVADQLPVEVYHQQFAEIDRVNNELGYPFLKKGIVVEMTGEDIAIPEKLLREAEWVTAVVNERDPSRYRQQFIKACDHPLINCIANPTGRIIGAQEGSTQNWDQLFKKAMKTGTALEVNAQPQHLDLSDRLIKGAAVSGVKIVVNSCAQLCSHYDYMQMGIIMARRGWCGKSDILNTGNWENVQRFKEQHLMTYKNDSHEKDTIDF